MDRWGFFYKSPNPSRSRGEPERNGNAGSNSTPFAANSADVQKQRIWNLTVRVPAKKSVIHGGKYKIGQGRNTGRSGEGNTIFYLGVILTK